MCRNLNRLKLSAKETQKGESTVLDSSLYFTSKGYNFNKAIQ